MHGNLVMEFGQKTTVSSYLVRRLEGNGRKFWRDKEIEQREGICIGFRTLSEGSRHYDSEYGWEYRATNYFRAALVVFSERENPVYVRLSNK